MSRRPGTTHTDTCRQHPAKCFDLRSENPNPGLSPDTVSGLVFPHLHPSSPVHRRIVRRRRISWSGPGSFRTFGNSPGLDERRGPGLRRDMRQRPRSRGSVCGEEHHSANGSVNVLLCVISCCRGPKTPRANRLRASGLSRKTGYACSRPSDGVRPRDRNKSTATHTNASPSVAQTTVSFPGNAGSGNSASTPISPNTTRLTPFNAPRS